MKRSKILAIAASLVLVSLLTLAVFESILSPPMVISSRSMQHDDNKSELGILDTGDLVIIDYQKSPSEIMTYAQSVSEGYTQFGEYGDVVLYHTDLSDIPIIHRAICRVIYNGDGTFNIPELSLLPEWMFSTSNGGWENLRGIVYLYNIGFKNITVPIDLDKILKKMGNDPHGGFLTMGDNNTGNTKLGTVGYIDQTSLSSVDSPILDEDIIGVAAAEIPWVGVLKLTVSGEAPDYLPLNSVVCLTAAVSAGTLCIAAAYIILKRRA